MNSACERQYEVPSAEYQVTAEHRLRWVLRGHSFPVPRSLFAKMGIRQWLKHHIVGKDDGSDVPPGSQLLNSLFGREQERVRSLGEYSADNYPQDLSVLLQQRGEVASEVILIDISDPQARMESIPRLRELLRVYPHPLVYEMLIHAYMDSGRYDEARGVAFAARERRIECARSEFPEVRAEVEHLKEWTPEEVDQLRAEREGARPAPAPPTE